jgi:4a-hydroxytetrahydrobiopterin dehydratase
MSDDAVGMDMLMGEEIAGAGLTDWRKLAQGLHARYRTGGFAAGARFVAAVGEAGDALGHHLRVTVSPDAVDLKLVSDDAIYTDDDGAAHVVQWVTRVDVDLARRISEIAAEHGLTPDPSSVALLTGNAEDQGRGTPEGDEIRDGLGRVPNLWFGDPSDGESGGQRFHLEVYVAPEVVEGRVAAAVAAGGTVVDDSSSPMLTVIADQDGNTGVLCTDVSAAPGA